MWRRWLVFLGGLGVVFVTVWWVTEQVGRRNSNFNQSEPTPTINENEKTFEQPTTFRSDTVISPNGNYLVNLDGFKSKGVWHIHLSIIEQNSDYGSEFRSRDDLRWTVESDELAWEYYRKFAVGWSRDSRRLAVVLNGVAYKWNFHEESETTTYEGVEYTKHKLRIASEEKKQIGIEQMINYPQRIFFIGEEKVYLSAQGGLYELFPEEKLILSVIEAGSGEFWPLLTEDGYAYLKDSDDQKSIILVLDRNGVEKEFLTPLSREMNFNGHVVMSPNSRNVCSETGASGYYGYRIFKLGSSELLDSGQQYSWCERWLDNNTVVVREKPYHSQWNEQFYSIDVRTGKRTLLGDWEDKSF